MDEDFIRDLLGRKEGPTLDFKLQHHDKGTELAKDIMAIANNLAIGERGHILFGVDEDPTEKTGIIVGLTTAAPDDATLQQQVKDKLNRVPSFTCQPFELDGRTIGFLEITGEGKRPYYPTKDSATVLTRNLPLKRIGTSTDPASPLEVIEWSRHDDPIQRERAKLELEEIHLARQPRMNIQVDTTTRARTGAGPNVVIANVGKCNLTVRSIDVRWRSTMTVVKLSAAEDADLASSEEDNIQTHRMSGSPIMPPLSRYTALVKFSQEEVARGFGDISGISRIEWEIIDVTVAAESEYGIPIEQKAVTNAPVRW
jgi:hypothetical protein